MPTASSILTGFLDLLSPPRCIACGESSFVQDEFCTVCVEQLERSELPDAAYVFIGPMARAIHQYKYGDRPELARALGRYATEGCVDVVGCVDCVIPVPLHRERRISRGYDQAALLGKEIANALSLPLDLRSLRRVRLTGQQVGRSRTERLAAMRAAFESRPLLGARVLLVDDVLTTGATFEAAASACREAGASDVRFLALARAPS